jgi:hypothetical protein
LRITSEAGDPVWIAGLFLSGGGDIPWGLRGLLEHGPVPGLLSEILISAFALAKAVAGLGKLHLC